MVVIYHHITAKLLQMLTLSSQSQSHHHKYFVLLCVRETLHLLDTNSSKWVTYCRVKIRAESIKDDSATIHLIQLPNNPPSQPLSLLSAVQGAFHRD